MGAEEEERVTLGAPAMAGGGGLAKKDGHHPQRFPVAIRGPHRSDGLKQQIGFSHCSGSQESEGKCQRAALPPEGVGRTWPDLAPPALRGCLHSLACGSQPSELCPPGHIAFSSSVSNLPRLPSYENTRDGIQDPSE